MSNQLIANPTVFLDEFKEDLLPLVRDNGQSYDRLKSNFMIAVQQNPDILKCTPESLRREMSKCAADGLVPDNKEAVILPYWDRDQKAHVANYQPMVYGIIKRMKELGSVFNIVCELVCANDTFSFNAADPDSLVHTWDVFSSTPRGETKAAYVIFRDEHKRVMHREIMTLEELKAVRAASKSPNSPAWVKFEGEMYQKVVLRRGNKYISINNDKIRALLERTDDMFDFQRGQPTTERVNPFTGQTIDGTVADTADKVEQKPDETKPHSDEKPASADKKQPNVDSEEKKAPKPTPETPPEFVDFMPQDADVPKIVEVVTKILNVALEPIAANARKDILFDNAAHWKEALPEYAHDFAKGCIDIADWSIKRDREGNAWASQHALFANKVKSALGVEKLALSKYPEGAK